mmetsp:Transcript_32042/g.69150  ORF Transcript_32042/g.69150 Transcript_32042/m.69150 type:complete len:353 (+) Transcript_32042:327-1385(+)
MSLRIGQRHTVALNGRGGHVLVHASRTHEGEGAAMRFCQAQHHTIPLLLQLLLLLRQSFNLISILQPSPNLFLLLHDLFGWWLHRTQGHVSKISSSILQGFQVLHRGCQQHLRVAAKVQGRRAQGAPVALHGFQDEAAPPAQGRTRIVQGEGVHLQRQSHELLVFAQEHGGVVAEGLPASLFILLQDFLPEGLGISQWQCQMVSCKPILFDGMQHQFLILTPQLFRGMSQTVGLRDPLRGQLIVLREVGTCPFLDVDLPGWAISNAHGPTCHLGVVPQLVGGELQGFAVAAHGRGHEEPVVLQLVGGVAKCQAVLFDGSHHHLTVVGELFRCQAQLPPVFFNLLLPAKDGLT